MNRRSIVLFATLCLARTAAADAPQKPAPVAPQKPAAAAPQKPDAAPQKPDAQAVKPDADPFAGLRFLVGEWVSTGDPAKDGEGRFTLAPDLAGKVLVRHNHAVMPSHQKGAPPVTHDDLVVFFVEGGKLKADYWDNEGHVIHYLVETTDNSATMESVPGPGPQFKLEYKSRSADLVNVAFSMKMPGVEHFNLHLQNDVKRVK